MVGMCAALIHMELRGDAGCTAIPVSPRTCLSSKRILQHNGKAMVTSFALREQAAGVWRYTEMKWCYLR